MMLIIGGFLLVLQGVEALLNGGNLFLGVALLLALALHHGLGGVGHEVVVRELLLHTRQEALQVLQVLLELGYLGIHIDEVAYRPATSSVSTMKALAAAALLSTVVKALRLAIFTMMSAKAA